MTLCRQSFRRLAGRIANPGVALWILLLTTLGLYAQRTLLVSTNDYLVLYPTNFWSQNRAPASNALGLRSAAVRDAGDFQPTNPTLSELAAITLEPGDILYRDGSTLTRRALGPIGYVLTSGTNELYWAESSSGSGFVTSVAATTDVSGLSYSGSPITGGGTLGLTGVVGLASGGTGGTNASQARANLGLGSASTNDVSAFQSFTLTFTNAPSTNVCLIPPGATAAFIDIQAHGGPGGSGRRGAPNTVRSGGAGGSGGGKSEITTPALSTLWSNVLIVVIGSVGMPGGEVATDDTNGTNGSNSGDMVIYVGSIATSNRIAYAGGGVGGGGGDSDGVGSQGGGHGTFQGGTSGASSATGGVGSSGSNSTSGNAGTGAGGGGGITSANVASAGGAGGFGPYAFNATSPSSGAGGPTNTVSGSAQDGGRGIINPWRLVTGPAAGGGGAALGANAGNGGNGAFGSGGGGGGAAENGWLSGAGGNGGLGYVRITLY